MAKQWYCYFNDLFINDLTGAFYSDAEASKHCKKCPNGSFVSVEKAPGVSHFDCKSCPRGITFSLMSFYVHPNKIHLHVNGFEPGLALIRSPDAT